MKTQRISKKAIQKRISNGSEDRRSLIHNGRRGGRDILQVAGRMSFVSLVVTEQLKRWLLIAQYCDVERKWAYYYIIIFSNWRSSVNDGSS